MGGMDASAVGFTAMRSAGVEPGARNVLVCLLVNDHPAPADRAAALIIASAACFEPITVALKLCSQRGMRSADQS